MVELLSTKLFIPRPRSNQVARPRLVEQLVAGAHKKLTLIAAPAGFGKTTLLSEWISHSPRCVTWLSLDETDNDPAQFWYYLITSLQQLHPDLGAGALALLQSPQAPPMKSILTSVINDITDFPDSFATVLDDYHLIESQPIHDHLTFLIDHLPGNMNLVLTTRVDPSLPLARLRANDQLTELRANDLRFTTQETTAFLSQVMRLNLSMEDVVSLESRTEGWIAGLQIAGLSMQGRDDLPAFVKAFSGSHRHILGYLAEEVLNQQSQGILNFLMHTSVLDRLCGPLCDAVTGETGGQSILENLEAANLFLMPLDDEGRWFRYHHLFAEVLQARLRRIYPDLVLELHRRASEWFEAHDAIAEAIMHALAARNTQRAADMIERERWRLLGRGEIITLHRWLDDLPSDLVRRSPGLCLAYALIYTFSEQFDAVEACLEDAEIGLEVIRSTGQEYPTQTMDADRGEITILRAAAALRQLNFPLAIELCRNALTLIPEENSLALGFATYYLGLSERRSGNMKEAERVFTKASTLCLQADNLVLAMYALANLSIVQISLGRLREAYEVSQNILQTTRERLRQASYVASPAYNGLAMLHYEWNDLEAAERYARLCIESGQSGGMASLKFAGSKLLAATLLARGDSNAADQVLNEIASMNEQLPHPFRPALAAAWQARLKLRQGHFEQAFNWAENCGLSKEDMILPFSRETEYLTLALSMIAQGHSEASLELLDRLLDAAEIDQRRSSCIEILALQALAYQQQGGLPEALDALERALTLAEPEGYVRTFVDEGEPMRALILKYQSSLKKKDSGKINDATPRLLAYTRNLLSAFSQPQPVAAQALDFLPESLSDREMDILRLIAAGCSNQEIAEKLVIAVSTVKTHINHLYGKLGANSRTQALVIARDLGLLSA